MKVKICGLSTAEQVKTCVDLKANYCGFILNYPKSHRFIQLEKAKELTNIEKKDTNVIFILVSLAKWVILIKRMDFYGIFLLQFQFSV